MSVVAKWSPISATAEHLFDFLNIAVRHLGFVVHVFGSPGKVPGGLYHCAEFGWKRCGGFDNVQVLIFYELGLKVSIHAPKMAFWELDAMKVEQSHRDPKKHFLAWKHVI